MDLRYQKNDHCSIPSSLSANIGMIYMCFSNHFSNLIHDPLQHNKSDGAVY